MKKIKASQFQNAFNTYGPEFTTLLQAEHGKLMHFNVPFVVNGALIFDAQVIYDELIKQHQHYVKPEMVRNIVKSDFVNGLPFLDGEEWRSHRKLMQPHFHHVHIREYGARMVNHTRQFASTWQDGDVRVIDTDMRTLTADIVMSTLFSTEGESQTDAIKTAMHDFSEAFGVQMRNAWLRFFPDWFPIPVLQRQRRADNVLKTVIKAMLEYRQQITPEERPTDLLSALMDATDEDSGDRLTEPELLAELLSLYIAGHETTAVTLSWAWILLAQNPQVTEKLHAELDTVLGGDDPTVESLSELQYTQWIVKETLRLYPPAWMILRESTVDKVFNGVTVPKGSMYLFASYPIHRDPTIYEQPDAFIPERWDNDFEKSLPKATYFPFGIGARTCIGNGFAMMEAQIILATLAQKYRLELLNEAQVAHTGLTLGFKDPVKVRILKRS